MRKVDAYATIVTVALAVSLFWNVREHLTRIREHREHYTHIPRPTTRRDIL